MEIVGDDGSIFKVKEDGFKAAFGRGSGFNTTDRTVSRRHVLFELHQTEPRVSFQVVGKNPLWLRSADGERKKITTFRNLEKGEIGPGDSFCISSQIPVWFDLKEIGENWGNVDISRVDPVKEFGFLVIGHEFDCYPKSRIRDPKNWDWFLEETRQEDGDSDDEKKRKRRKRKKDEDEDDEWSDESEDIETTTEPKKGSRPKYMTRSKDKSKPPRNKERKKDSSRMKIDEKDEEEEEDDDEEDETLGGFIVKDEDEEEETKNDNEEEEEEEELMEDEEDEE